jgi:TRPM family ion channel
VARADGPVVIRVAAARVGTSPEIQALVEEYRAGAEAFVFLSGGAAEVSDAVSGQLRALLDALSRVAAEGVRLAVGDGGTRAGIMEWAGLVRQGSGAAFPLLGVAPAAEVTATGEPGRTAIDPNHSHVVLVSNPEGTQRQGADRTGGGGRWGAETDAMYEIFGRLSAGRASVAVVVNGGAITLDEVRRNLVQRRPILVVAGSGRAADAIVARVRGITPPEPAARQFLDAVDDLGLDAHRDLVHVVDLRAGAAGLAERLSQLLRPPA